jgi:hypothetical protein
MTGHHEQIDCYIANVPDTAVGVRERFGFIFEMVVPIYSQPDTDFFFDEQTMLAGLRLQPPRDGVGLPWHGQVRP